MKYDGPCWILKFSNNNRWLCYLDTKKYLSWLFTFSQQSDKNTIRKEKLVMIYEYISLAATKKNSPTDLTNSHLCLTYLRILGFKNQVSTQSKIIFADMVFSYLLHYQVTLEQVSLTFISPCRLSSQDISIINILSSRTLFWGEVLNLWTCARVWPLRGTTLKFKVLCSLRILPNK